MFIVSRRDVKLDGNNPTWLYGYGGFSVSLPPSFSVARVQWMSHYNGVFAMANIRGGGEYGEAWYKAGVKLKKKNCFTDFCSAAEFLIEKGYTRSVHKFKHDCGCFGESLVWLSLVATNELSVSFFCSLFFLAFCVQSEQACHPRWFERWVACGCVCERAP
jgi:prolyl oligopeptidase